MSDSAIAFLSIYNFTTTFFRNPNDPNLVWGDPKSGSPWAPLDSQVSLYDYIDFGYDMHHCVLKPTQPAEILVMKWPRQVGKTEGVASATAAMLIMNQRCRIGVMSANEKTVKDFVNRVKFFIENSIFVNKISSCKTDYLELDNGSCLESWGNTLGIKGHSYRVVIIDEAALVDPECIEGASFPTVRQAGFFISRKTPSIIMLSTPRGPKGPFISYFVRGLNMREIGCRKCGLKRPLSHPDFQGIRFMERDIPSLQNCPNCNANEYEYVPNGIIPVSIDPFKHPTKTREEIMLEYEMRTNKILAKQEIFGEIIAEGQGVFQESWLTACADKKLLNERRPVEGIEYTISADFGKVHDATVFMVGHTVRTSQYLDYIQRIESVNGIEYGEIIYHLMRLICLFKPTRVIFDATGIGNSLVEQLRDYILSIHDGDIDGFYFKNGTKIFWKLDQIPDLLTIIYSNKPKQLGFIFDYNTKIDIIDNLSLVLQQNVLHIPLRNVHEDVQELYEELINFGFDYTSNNRIVYGAQVGFDDCVIALALLSLALRDHPYVYVQAQIGGESSYVL